MIAFADDIDAEYARLVFEHGLMRSIAPRPIIPTWEWVCLHGRTPEGQPFDGTRMPWAKGVCDAWDDPSIREIVLMWGTRLGKTMVAMQLAAKAMATNPLPGLFATANERLATRTTRNKFYKVLAAIRETRRQLLPQRLRSIREIRLAESTWPVIWSGSNTMLADWGACYGWANEVTKWDTSRSMDGQAKAGDTLAQFLERFKEFWHQRKIVFECSPGLKGHCRIEQKYLTSNQCKFYVPCPHCHGYQTLRLGNGSPGGIVFDKLSDGRFDPDLAQRTARYVCEHCAKGIPDEHRAWMMRRGRWAPRGCTVDRAGRLCGDPERKYDVWGGQLSSLYSLQLRWGDIARKFVEVRHNPALLQVFINDWLSETWEPRRIKSEPEDVAERLATEDELGVMPEWSTWLFAAVDVQAEYFKWAKIAAGPGERVAVVDRGVCDTWSELYAHCIDSKTKHADGSTLLPCLTLVDSGDGKKTDEVYKQCREWSRLDRLVIPCKGANTDMGGEPWKIIEIVPGSRGQSRVQRRKALRASGVLRIRVNSFYYEPIIQRWLDSRRPGDADSLSLPADLADDHDFVHEICNAAMSDEPSKLDPDRLLWVKRWTNEPNDFRDVLKYARCAMDVKFRGDWRTAERRQPGQAAVAPAPRQSADTRSERARRRELRGHGRRLSIRGRRLAR